MFKRLLAAGLVAGFASFGAQAAACTVPSAATDMVNGIAAGLNQARQSQGLARIGFNRQLAQAAQAQACDVAATGRFDHRGSDGSNSHTRVERTGYDTCLTAENLAWGFPDPSRIINGWMNSAGHRRNMLHPRIGEFGVGLAQGASGPVWVLVVARSC